MMMAPRTRKGSGNRWHGCIWNNERSRWKRNTLISRLVLVQLSVLRCTYKYHSFVVVVVVVSTGVAFASNQTVDTQRSLTWETFSMASWTTRDYPNVAIDTTGEQCETIGTVFALDSLCDGLKQKKAKEVWWECSFFSPFPLFLTNIISQWDVIKVLPVVCLFVWVNESWKRDRTSSHVVFVSHWEETAYII
jgi:hypothetical protein